MNTKGQKHSVGSKFLAFDDVLAVLRAGGFFGRSLQPHICCSEPQLTENLMWHNLPGHSSKYRPGTLGRHWAHQVSSTVGSISRKGFSARLSSSPGSFPLSSVSVQLICSNSSRVHTGITNWSGGGFLEQQCGRSPWGGKQDGHALPAN